MTSGDQPEGSRRTAVTAAWLNELTGDAPTPIAWAARSIVAMAVPTSRYGPTTCGGNPYAATWPQSTQTAITAVGCCSMPGDTIRNARIVPGSSLATYRCT